MGEVNDSKWTYICTRTAFLELQKMFFWPSSPHWDCQILPLCSGSSVFSQQPLSAQHMLLKILLCRKMTGIWALRQTSSSHLHPVSSLSSFWDPNTLMSQVFHSFLRLFGSSLLEPTTALPRSHVKQITMGNILHRFRSSDRRGPCRNPRCSVLYTKGICRT